MLDPRWIMLERHPSGEDEILDGIPAVDVEITGQASAAAKATSCSIRRSRSVTGGT
jgi:hypothetical protein